ncbi:MAG: DM13 domain-containing protein [Rhizobiaceae bacterium]
MRWLLVFLFGAVLGTGFGVALGFFLFPYVFPPPPAAEEPRTEQSERIGSGRFIHANPSDPVHYGRGEVSVFSDHVRLHEDFQVGPGPKYHVYLVPKPAIRSSGDLGNAMFVDLGRLRAFKGSQNYAIPAGVNPQDYQSVIIWCEQFSVLISPADLTFGR